MRPTKLTVSAFGPYAEKITLEFDRLGENGLYLITGNTGAGKTSIFDAIAYVLYDKPSSDVRDDSMLRAKYAAPSLETYVEMEFLYRNQPYRVRRNPEYERPKTRGGGTTKQSPKAELQYPDGHIVSKNKKEVTKAIEALLGIDRNQFLQIAMIAQGDFLRLLLAKTDERKAIFRKIFKTQIFESVQLQLKEDVKQLSAKLEESSKSILAYSKNIVCDPHHYLVYEAEAVRNGAFSTEDTVKLLEILIEDDRMRENQISSRSSIVAQALSMANVNIGKAKEYQKNLALLREKKERLSEMEARLAQAGEDLEVQRARQSQRDRNEADIAELEATIPRYDELHILKREISALDEQIQRESREKTDCVTASMGKERDLLRMRAQHLELQDADARKGQLEVSKNQLLAEEYALNGLLDDLNGYAKLCNEYQQKQTEYLLCASQFRSAAAEHQRLQLAFLNEQAGIMATTLTDGEPCPVCGAHHHPSPARTTRSAPSESDLKKAKAVADDLQAVADRKSAECARLKGQAETELAKMQAKIEELLGAYPWERVRDELIKKINAVRRNLSSLEKVIEEENNRLSIKKTLERKIPELENEIALARTKTEALTKSLSASQAKREEKANRVSAIAATLKYYERGIAVVTLANLKQRREDMKKALENAMLAFNAIDKSVSVLHGEIASLEKIIEAAADIDLETELKNRVQLMELTELLQKDFSDVSSRLFINRNALEQIRKNAAKACEHETTYRWLNALSETANGGLGGKEKIMFETYVQMEYFDRILCRANFQLRRMTGGQYEMLRHEAKGDLKAQSGLDLDVIDHYNGSVRPVHSLSGGEAFKAALSLALGLSDEIQASAGGVRLDCMFIDEGFGSLDDESLRVAVSVLQELTEGNRLVGIISHVSELKNKIEKQIVVTKEISGGSRCRIVT
ncbi:MAG: SMC family ATPase [Clostridia bacterium]|nr:SMC family ATPase [Clostridia bacterium]